MPLFSSPLAASIFDSDESDAASQQSNDSSSYLSSQFQHHARLSFSPKLSFNANNQVLPALSNMFDRSVVFDQDDFLQSDISQSPSELSWQSNTGYTMQYKTSKRKRHEPTSLRTPNQSPYTRRKNLHHVQENTFQSPKAPRRSRCPLEDSSSMPSSLLGNLVNINPFVLHHNQPTHRYNTRLVAKRESPSLRQLIIPRFEQEFRHESFLGHGQLSNVHLCTNRLDGLLYAIKSSKAPVLGTSHEQFAWREICAYAVLISHEHLVRYYSAWVEPDGRFFIQMEHCHGGSLNGIVATNRQEQRFLDEEELMNIFHQISDALTFMHGQDLAHMNIKPENVMLCQRAANDIVYKLTDLSHVSQIRSCVLAQAGDRRYTAAEATEPSKQVSLDKCDIFSFGLTLYVCATNADLPAQGIEWQQLRLRPRQYLRSIPYCTEPFNELLLERMCNASADRRPSARQVGLAPGSRATCIVLFDSLASCRSIGQSIGAYEP